MKKRFAVSLLSAALLAAGVVWTGCGGGGGSNGSADTPAKLAGTWRVYHTPSGGSELVDTWSITPQAGNDATLTITSSGSGTTFNGTVKGTTITASLPDYSDTVTMTGTVVTEAGTMIGITMSGTYTSTSGETGTWRGANLAYVTLQSIQVTPTEASVVAGNTIFFAATAAYSDGYTEVTSSATWSPATGSIASVSGGVARGWSAGDAMVTASIGNVVSNVAVLHVTNAYGLASLSGAWLVDTTADRNAGYDFFMTDGSGYITASSFYTTPGANTYSVQNNGSFTLTVTPIAGPPASDITGTLTSSTTGTLSGVGPNSTIYKVSDLTLCQGAWTGALSVSSSPVHDLAFTIKADGTLDTAATRTITPSGGGAAGTLVSGVMVGQGNLCVGYFTTTMAEPFNAFRINGTLITEQTTTLTGNFDNDSGIAWPVGTVSLTR